MSRICSPAPCLGPPRRFAEAAFTLIELIVVISIITLLIGLLMPALGGARKQAKMTACLARLRDMGTATVTYATGNFEVLPPMMIDWYPAQFSDPTSAPGALNIKYGYGWAELLYADMFPLANINDRTNFPAQRNFEDKYGRVFNCPEGVVEVSHSSHYRVYEPGWSREAAHVDPRAGKFTFVADRLTTPTHLSRLDPLLPLIGDATENSARGDGRDGVEFITELSTARDCGQPDSSFIGIGDLRLNKISDRLDVTNSRLYNEANMVNPDGCVPNRFCHRHRGGANYLFGDMHAENSRTLREELGCDWNLNLPFDADSSEARRVTNCSTCD